MENVRKKVLIVQFLSSSQKASIAELKAQLFEERDQRREEREKAATDLKAAVQRAQSEAQEEFKRLSDSSLRQERELQEVINKLQESEKESCLLVDTLRFKLVLLETPLFTIDAPILYFICTFRGLYLDCPFSCRKMLGKSWSSLTIKSDSWRPKFVKSS